MSGTARLLVAVFATSLVACADAMAPHPSVAATAVSTLCDDPTLSPGCDPPPPPQDSSYVCMLSHDVATGEWWEWCGWVPGS